MDYASALIVPRGFRESAPKSPAAMTALGLGNFFRSSASKAYMMRKIGDIERPMQMIAIFVLTVIVLSWLPLIPVLEAPVTRPEWAIYRWSFVSLFKLYRIVTGNWVGMSYRMGWQSLLGLGAICVISGLVAIYSSNRRHYCKSMPECPTKKPPNQ